MIPTANEITLARRLHDLLKARKQLPEIREGDWVLDDKYQLLPTLIGSDAPLYQRTKTGRERHVLLWSWSRCREWLRERGYFLAVVNDCNPGKVYFEFAEDKFIKTGKSFGKWGQTDAEAAMAVMVQIVEEEKNGK